jgi:hypothetical protein
VRLKTTKTYEKYKILKYEMKLYGSRGLKMSSLIRRSNVVVGVANDKEHSSLSAMASHFIIYIVSLVVHKDVDHLKIKLDWKKQ